MLLTNDPAKPYTTFVNATEVLVAAHRQFLAFVEKRVESRETAEDILQDAFIKSIEHAAALKDEETVVAWFYRVLRNAVIDHYRRRAAGERALQSWTPEPTPEARAETCACVLKLLDTLKPEYRDALTNVDVQDHSLNEYAQSSGITPNNAAVRIHRARAALRKQVQKACSTCAEHGCFNCTC